MLADPTITVEEVAQQIGSDPPRSTVISRVAGAPWQITSF